MPTPSLFHANWTAVTFTPVSGSPVTFTHVDSVQFDPGGQLLAYKGDANRYNIAQFNFTNDPSATVECTNMAQLAALNIGVVGTLVATLNDAKNLAVTGGGAIIFTLNNAVIKNLPLGAQHAALGKGTVSFASYSSDGVTGPLSSAAA